MVFDLSAWNQSLAGKLRGLGGWLKHRAEADVPYVAYGALCGATLLPALEAARSGQIMPVAVAIGSVAAGVGGNLIAEQILRWKDGANQIGEEQIARWVADNAGNADVRAALDAILEKLDAIPQAQAALGKDDRQWFVDSLRSELDRLGSLPRFEAVLTGSGVIAQGEGAAAAGERGVVAQQAGIVVTGDRNILVLDEAFFRRVIGQTAPPADLQKAAQRYLQYLVDRYRYLDFKGMGVSDRVPLRLSLHDLYVPLKARVELPHGETWPRDDLRVAGRKVPEADRENIAERLSGPLPLLDLLGRHSGLVILGDPGAGKTTFLKFLTLHLASGAGADARLPVLAPLSAYANALAERNIRLDDFIAGYFHDLGADLPIDAMLRQALQAGSAVVMLDGLDEVKDLRLRDTVVRRVVDFYTFHRPAGNRFILTSRIIGYRDVRPTAEGLAECTLVDFDDADIEDFVNRWTQAIEKAARGDTAVTIHEAERERRELLDAIRRNPGVRRLAANPLLLTILALMKRQGVTLPERRVELYQKYVETLLSSWNRARGLDRPPARDLDVVETVKVLAPLALWMHEVNPGVGLVKHGDLKSELEASYRRRGEPNPEQAARVFLSDVRDYAGLLLERGAGQYGFIHLTFEEYLAAIALAQQGQQSVEPIVTALAKHIGDPAWREVSLLTIGYLGIVQQRDEAAAAVIEGLLTIDAGESGEPIVLAGDAVADAWPGGVTPAGKGKTVSALLATMRDDARVKPRTRARAGSTLGRLGDPRFRPDAWYLPDEPLLGFVEIPAGSFWMGEDEEQHEVTLPRYFMARCLVTNAQYACFVKADGYAEPRYWREAAAASIWRDGRVQGRFDDTPRDGPVDYSEPFNTANHPVVGITWYEALAYCQWLTERLQAWERTPEPLAALLRGHGWRITLPGEAEWEKAARGTDRRTYPWGNEPDPNRANFDKSGVGATSAAGCFPGGVSPYGCVDMAGNVWEWTCSVYEKYPYDPKDGRENLDAGKDAPRVLRGGAFFDGDGGVRGAVRGWYNPDDRHRFVGFRVVVSPL